MLPLNSREQGSSFDLGKRSKIRKQNPAVGLYTRLLHHVAAECRDYMMYLAPTKQELSKPQRRLLVAMVLSWFPSMGMYHSALAQHGIPHSGM